jgi:hypothetical protein
MAAVLLQVQRLQPLRTAVKQTPELATGGQEATKQRDMFTIKILLLLVILLIPDVRAEVVGLARAEHVQNARAV